MGRAVRGGGGRVWRAAHVGRGGWTWYTGSAGWMYRLGVEAILGLRREGQSLVIDPSIPAEWPGYDITYREGRSRYHIHVENANGAGRNVREVILDGKPLPDGRIPLTDDGQDHAVTVRLGGDGGTLEAAQKAEAAGGEE